MGYVLANAEERERGHRETFVIPGRQFRHALKVGDFVKLVFTRECPPAAERMWVEIVSVGTMDLATGRLPYVGVLRNYPVDETLVKYGDEVRFAPEHVADFERPTRAD